MLYLLHCPGHGRRGNCRGVEQPEARWAHNPKVAGSSPAPATMIADEKAARQKNHEKRTVFHGFLLFMRQKRVFMKSEVKIIF